MQTEAQRRYAKDKTDPKYLERKRQRERQWLKDNPEKAAAKRRRARLKMKYGITVEDYDAMLVDQGGGCAICGATDPGESRGYFCVDHCHETKEVRGLLCDACNLGVGKFNDDPDRLERAAAYVRRKP